LTEFAFKDARLESVRQELTLTAELMLLACRVGRALAATGPGAEIRSLSPTFRTDSANKLLSLIEMFKEHWNKRYMPEGMRGSLVAMNNLLLQFVPGDETKSR
jgi:hypothetical protein